MYFRSETDLLPVADRTPLSGSSRSRPVPLVYLLLVLGPLPVLVQLPVLGPLPVCDPLHTEGVGLRGWVPLAVCPYLVAGGAEEPAGPEEDGPERVAVEAVLRLVEVCDVEARLV